MNDIPEDWAIQIALEAPNAVEGYGAMKWTVREVKEAHKELRYAASVMAHAALIAKHETAPVDPDEEAVKRILAAYYGDGPNHGTYLPPEMLARAVSQYKKEKANG